MVTNKIDYVIKILNRVNNILTFLGYYCAVLLRTLYTLYRFVLLFSTSWPYQSCDYMVLTHML